MPAREHRKHPQKDRAKQNPDYHENPFLESEIGFGVLNDASHDS